MVRNRYRDAPTNAALPEKQLQTRLFCQITVCLLGDKNNVPILKGTALSSDQIKLFF